MSNKIVTVQIKLSYASGSRKSWWKHVKGIDPSQKGGYAYVGDFLKEGETELQVGSVLLEVEPCGSVKNGYQDGKLYRVAEDGSLDFICRHNWREASVSLRKAAEAALA